MECVLLNLAPRDNTELQLTWIGWGLIDMRKREQKVFLYSSGEAVLIYMVLYRII